MGKVLLILSNLKSLQRIPFVQVGESEVTLMIRVCPAKIEGKRVSLKSKRVCLSRFVFELVASAGASSMRKL